MMTRLLGLMLVVLCGCAGSLESNRMAAQMVPRAAGETRDSRRCQMLDQTYRTASAWEAFCLSLAAGTGAGQLPVNELPERYQGGTRFGLALGTIGASACGAYAAQAAKTAAETWARECQ